MHPTTTSTHINNVLIHTEITFRSLLDWFQRVEEKSNQKQKKTYVSLSTACGGVSKESSIRLANVIHFPIFNDETFHSKHKQTKVCTVVGGIHVPVCVCVSSKEVDEMRINGIRLKWLKQ